MRLVLGALVLVSLGTGARARLGGAEPLDAISDVLSRISSSEARIEKRLAQFSDTHSRKTVRKEVHRLLDRSGREEKQKMQELATAAIRSRLGAGEDADGARFAESSADVQRIRPEPAVEDETEDTAEREEEEFDAEQDGSGRGVKYAMKPAAFAPGMQFRDADVDLGGPTAEDADLSAAQSANALQKAVEEELLKETGDGQHALADPGDNEAAKAVVESELKEEATVEAEEREAAMAMAEAMALTKDAQASQEAVDEGAAQQQHDADVAKADVASLMEAVKSEMSARQSSQAALNSIASQNR